MENTEKQQMKILAIGNSFSQDATAYLYDIAKAAEIDMKVVNLYIGGCSLERHWNNVLADAKEYVYELNGHPTGKQVSIQEALQEERWDYVTLQQVSNLSGDYNTYQPYLKNLSGSVKKYAPQAEQVIHQTWAYEEGSERLIQIAGYASPEEMFKALQAAYEEASKDLGGRRIIPSGQVFQNLLSHGFKALHRDTFHASIPQGRNILGAVWYEFFTGRTIKENPYCPKDMSEIEWNHIKQWMSK